MFDNLLIEENCSTFVGELYHICRQIIVQLWVDYKTLVGVGISTSHVVSLMFVISMTQSSINGQKSMAKTGICKDYNYC